MVRCAARYEAWLYRLALYRKVSLQPLESTRVTIVYSAQQTFAGYIADLQMGTVLSYIAESRGELLFVFGAVFTAAYLLHRRRNVSHSGLKLPPAMPSLPIVGSLPFLSTKFEDLAELCISPRNKLGKIFSLRFGPK